jgi:TPR repeat protein
VSVLLLPILAAHADALQDALAGRATQGLPAAVRLLEPLAAAGDAQAQVQLGTLYYHGHGVRESDALALRWYDRAARQGLAEAQFTCSPTCTPSAWPRCPRGTMRCAWRAVVLRGRAPGPHADAQYSLGMLFLTGSGVTQSAAEARKWIAAPHARAMPTPRPT